MNLSPRYKTCRSALRHFVTIAGSSLLAFSFASAADYYWDSNDGAAGFGSTAGTWVTPTPSTATSGFSTDSTGSTTISANPDVSTTTADNVYLGTVANPYTGKITIVGKVQAAFVSQGGDDTDRPQNFGVGNGAEIEFGPVGVYEMLRAGSANLGALTISGAATSMTIRNLYSENLNIAGVTWNNSGPLIHEGPGRIAVTSEAQLGAAGQDFVFAGGVVRFNDIAYTSLTALNAARPIVITNDKDVGIEMSKGGVNFDVDFDLTHGSGGFSAESNSSSSIILSGTNTYTGLTIVGGGNLQISDAANIGAVTAPIYWYAGGNLIIAGTSMSDLGSRDVFIRGGAEMRLTIEDAGHSFTVGQVIADNTSGTLLPREDLVGACGLDKEGPGTLVLTADNSYTDATNVNGGTLALVGGSQASAITVSSGASLGFEIGSATTSSSSVDLTNGDVTISNPGAVDGETEYLLMTANGGFTFTDITTQLGTVVTGYALALQNTDTELWLVPSGSPYEDWAPDAPNELFGDDKNGDGVTNGLAFLLGAANATDDATGLLPVVAEDTGALILTFSMLNADNRGDASLSTQHSSDLGVTDLWTSNEVVVPDTSGTVSGVAFVIGEGDPLNTVQATIPDTETADGKLFGRVNADDGVVVE